MDKSRWDQIGALFSKAVELAPDERPGFLTDACGEDAALRRDVESLLAAHGNLDEVFLGELDAASVAKLIDAAENAPERIGPWRVLAEIGRGGMGVVYKARRDDGQFEQQVALKLIKRGMDSDQIQQRFFRERQILAGMDHPGIAHLLDGGVTPDGRPWFALEHIEGVLLPRYCEEHQLGIEQRLRLFTEVCAAVEYAHRNLVVHRDLKPSNILVDSQGRVKLLDFGIAKLLSDDETLDETRTAAEGRLMTPGYGAPELVLGGQITTATDVYSLGIILYELLTGKLPYRLTQGDVASQMLALADSEPPKLSTLAADDDPSSIKTRFRRRLGRELDTIARKAIQSEPERRYASAAALREDVERYVRGEPVLACPDSLFYRARKLVQRHRASFAAAALVVLSLLLGLSAALWQAGVAARERDLARQEAVQTEQVKDFIIDLFSATDPRDLQGAELTAKRLLDRGLERVRSSLGTRPDIRLELLTAIAEASKLLGDHQGAQTLFAEALAIEVGSEARDRLRVAAALNGFGETAASLRDDRQAEEYHRRALDIRLEFAGPDSRDTAQSYNNLAVALAGQRKLSEAIEIYGQALDILERVAEETDPEMLNTLGNLAVAHRLQGDYREAERLLRTVVARMRRQQGEDHPYMITYQSQLAAVQSRLGNYREAESLLRKGLELSREIWGESHPTTSLMMNNYAMAAHTVGNDVEAEALMRKNLAYNLEQHGPEHPYIAINRDNLGGMLLELGRVDEAIAQHEMAQDLHTRVSSPQSLAVSKIRHARARLAAGNLDHARQLADQALTSERQRDQPSHELLILALTASASINSALGLTEEAAAEFKEALALHERLGSARHPNAGAVLFGLGKLQLAQGQLDEARDDLERASEIWTETLPESHWRRAELHVALGEYWLRAGNNRQGQQLLNEGIAQLEHERGKEHWRTRTAVSKREALMGVDRN